MTRELLFLSLALVVGGCGEAPRPSDKSSPESGASAVPTPAVAAQLGEAATATGVPAVSGPPRSNKYLQVAVTHAGFDPAAPPAPSGQRHYTVGLKGIGRARGSHVELDLRSSVMAQNERGCVSPVDLDATWLKRPLGAMPSFEASRPTEGQLSFLVPADTQRVRILIAPADNAGLIVPAGEEFEPTWPVPVQTIEDGSTLRVLVLPSPPTPAALGTPPAGRENVVLDFVIQNLKDTQGIEFATSQQLRLVDSTGTFVQQSELTRLLGCRLDDGDVIPPGHARRFAVVYELPAGTTHRLQYRGFEVAEASVDLN